MPASTLTELKLAVIQNISPYASAVMLEPEYSAAQAIVAGALPGHVGFLSALEEQGYLGDPHARQTTCKSKALKLLEFSTRVRAKWWLIPLAERG